MQGGDIPICSNTSVGMLPVLESERDSVIPVSPWTRFVLTMMQYGESGACRKDTLRYFTCFIGDARQITLGLRSFA